MGSKKKGQIYIGTSGWHYKHWVGRFYPEATKPKDYLTYYLKYFRTVELNNPFYRLPNSQTFEKWKNAVPTDFIFSVKASRFITHKKKLKDSTESLHNFLNNVNSLGHTLGPILFQLPPGWEYNEERLSDFLHALPPSYRYTFEFRNTTWHNDNAYSLLKAHKCAFCIYELEYHISPIISTTDFIYIRLHGPGTKYAGSYSLKSLETWAARCMQWQSERKDVYLYFDNDQLGYAAFNAISMIE
ncbi:MAG TPA: DUF72 domain-containing protein, partial [Cytophagaceae bacterium]